MSDKDLGCVKTIAVMVLVAVLAVLLAAIFWTMAPGGVCPQVPTPTPAPACAGPTLTPAPAPMEVPEAQLGLAGEPATPSALAPAQVTPEPVAHPVAVPAGTATLTPVAAGTPAAP